MKRLLGLVILFACSAAFAEELGTQWLGSLPAGPAPYAQKANLDFGAPWTTEDTARQTLITFELLYDWAQTRYIGQHCDQWKEVGILSQVLYGECPNLKRLAIGNAILIPGFAWVMTRIERQNRTIFQRMFIIAEGHNVYGNRQLGLGASWPW